MSDFTQAQDQAIHKVGRSILVSAAAGSGKTTVLAERCAHLVIDAQPRTTIDRLLVMTFAEEAAAEMKSRIEKRLAAKYLEAVQEKSADAEHLKWQAMLAPGAHISTIHAFCARLIRQNFHLAALDPAFRVLDGAEASLLREEVSEQLFEEAMEGANGEAVKALVDLYGDGRDEVLRRRMIQTYETLRGIREAKLWRGRALEELETAAGKSRLVESEIGRGYLKLVTREVASVRAEAMLIAMQAKQYDSPGSYVTQPQEMVTLLDEVAGRLSKGEFDGADGVLDHTFARMSPKHGVPKDVAEELKKRLSKLRERMTDREKGSLRSLLGRSEAELLTDLARTTPHARTFMELVREFEQRYHREKLQLNTLDFSDLEHVALALLGRDQDGVMVPSDLARRLHQRYDYVLVDEYQDINPVQEAILHLVSRECVLDEGKTGNLFCVGDVKQSIYRFRLAAPDIFLKRRERYVALEGGVSIDLRENFRSRGVLLQAVNAVFRRLMKKESAEIEYDQTHEFVPGLNYAAGEGTFAGVPIELHVLEKDIIRSGEAKAGDGEEGAEGQGPSRAKDTEEDSEEDLEAAEMEARHVAQLVQELLRPADGAARQVWDKELKGYRPIHAGDVVILLRSIRQRTREYAKAFADVGISLRSESRSGFFKAVEVQETLAILRVLDNQQQDIPLAAVIRSAVTGFRHSEDALATIACRYKGIPFNQAVTQYAAEQEDEIALGLRALLVKLARWRQVALQRSTEELISTIYRETSLPAWYAALPNGEQRLANLQYLHQCASKFATFSRQGLYRFLSYLEDLEERDSLA
jgi:ATP-dependent helicase/nuclease subunit A